MMKITALPIPKLDEDEIVPLDLVELATFDKWTCRYATQAEDHLQQLCEREPANPFLWTSLGNLHSHTGRPDVAESAYHRAPELDPSARQVPAGCMFAW